MRGIGLVLVTLGCVGIVAPALAVSADCSGGLKSDDGSFETALGFSSFSANASLAMGVHLPAAQNALSAACFCWFNSSSVSNHDLHFDVNVWAADGTNGAPGTFLGGVANAHVTGPTGAFGNFYRVTFDPPLVLNRQDVYVGAFWDPSTEDGWSICTDTDGPGGQSAYSGTFHTSHTPPTAKLGVVGNSPDYKALGIREEVTQIGGACTPSDTAICLNNNRFRLEATFASPNGGASGQAHAVKLTEDTGYLWFFNSANIETVVKLLNGCGVNGHYWAFAGGLTNVNVVLTITDTKDGTTQRVYTNPQGKAFLPIQDVAAFATCP